MNSKELDLVSNQEEITIVYKEKNYLTSNWKIFNFLEVIFSAIYTKLFLQHNWRIK